jgi:hypothetical protein
MATIHVQRMLIREVMIGIHFVFTAGTAGCINGLVLGADN